MDSSNTSDAVSNGNLLDQEEDKMSATTNDSNHLDQEEDEMSATNDSNLLDQEEDEMIATDNTTPDPTTYVENDSNEDHCKLKSTKNAVISSAVATPYGIVVVGHRGAGKRTLINHWLSSDGTDGETASPLTITTQETHKTIVRLETEQLEGETAVDSASIRLKSVDLYDVHIIDEKVSRVTSGANPQMCLLSRLPSNISLIIFVFRHGRFSEEDKEIFESVIESMHATSMEKISYLVITNCDDINSEAKKGIIKDFMANPNTCNIAKHMKKIFCIGLPDLSKVMVETRDELRKVVIESKLQLQSLFAIGLDKTSPSLSIDKLLRLQDPPTKRWFWQTKS